MIRPFVTRLVCLLLAGHGTALAAMPNIVLIISDDQAYSDFGFMGHDHVVTPNLDRLAAQSARFVNGYVPTSVCRPSLVTLLTGLYPHQHGVHFNHPPPGFARLTNSPEMTKERYDNLRDQAVALIRDVPTLPRVLARSGYRSLQTGKFWEGHYRNAGFTDGMTLAEPSDCRLGNKQLPGGEWVAHGNGDAGLAIGRQTMQPIVEFLDQQGEQPFFLWYAPFLPHTPHDSPQRFHELYADPGVPVHRRPYYASCSHFDETCGQLIKMIEDRGLAEETIFVFVIDNGWAPIEKRVGQTEEYSVDIRTKRSPFDRGLRTPILIRWDGQVVPATHAALCSSVDIIPTLLSAVGLDEHVTKLPGVDLMPAALGKRPLTSRPVFGEIYPGDASTLGQPQRDVAYRWVRDGDYKLIVPHEQNGTIWREYVTTTSLFNVVEDPYEVSDLAQDLKHAETVARLGRVLDQWWNPQDD